MLATVIPSVSRCPTSTARRRIRPALAPLIVSQIFILPRHLRVITHLQTVRLTLGHQVQTFKSVFRFCHKRLHRGIQIIFQHPRIFLIQIHVRPLQRVAHLRFKNVRAQSSRQKPRAVFRSRHIRDHVLFQARKHLLKILPCVHIVNIGIIDALVLEVLILERDIARVVDGQRFAESGLELLVDGGVNGLDMFERAGESDHERVIGIRDQKGRSRRRRIGYVKPLNRNGGLFQMGPLREVDAKGKRTAVRQKVSPFIAVVFVDAQRVEHRAQR